MQAMPHIHRRYSLVNGMVVDYITIQDRGFQYGDGLFETIACRDNVLEFWAAHMKRLRQGAERLQLACPEETIWLQDIRILVEHYHSDTDNGKTTGNNGFVVKLVLTRGSSERGYRPVETTDSTRVVQIMTGLPSRYFHCLTSPAKLCCCQQTVSINPSLAGIKHLNRLENVLARNEWKDNYTEGLMCDAYGHVIEGTMSNIFGFRQDALFTPALTDSGVNGILRQYIMQLAENFSIPVSIVKLSIEDLFSMTELFICNSLLEILPVISLRYDDITWQAKDYRIAEKLNKGLQKLKKNHGKKL